MSERTADDVIRSNACNTYVMSCHTSRHDLYKTMRGDIRIMCDQYATLKAQNDGLLAEVEEWRAIKATYLIEYAARPNGFRPGQYRGHAHDIDGIWDRDNGTLAGCKCAACMMHQAAIANAEATPCD